MGLTFFSSRSQPDRFLFVMPPETSMSATASSDASWLEYYDLFLSPDRSAPSAHILLITIAILWGFYRIFQLYWKPLGELIAILGLDIPLVPVATLAAIKQDSVRLQWPSSEALSSTSKYLVKLNGSVAGETGRHSTSVYIRNLQPNTQYQVQIVAVNAKDFESSSNIICFRTPPGSVNHSTLKNNQNTGSSGGSFTTGREYNSSEGPARSREPFVEPITPTAIPMTRENSGNQSQGKKQGLRHRTSAAVLSSQNGSPRNIASQNEVFIEQLDLAGTVDELSRQFESVQKELADVQSSSKREEEECASAQGAAASQTEQLKKSIQERENGSSDLKKDYNQLDRTSKTFQKEKRERELQFQAKQAEREKTDQDILRCKRDISDLKRKRERLEREEQQNAGTVQKKINDAKGRLQEDKKETGNLDDEIKAKGMQVRELESERKKRSPAGDSAEKRDIENAKEKEKDTQYGQRQSEFIRRFTLVSSSYDQTDANYKKVSNRFRLLQTQYSTQTQQLMPSLPDAEAAITKKKQNRRSRQRKSRSNTGSSSEAGGVPYQNPLGSNPVAFTSAAPYYGMPAGAAMASGMDQIGGIPNESDISSSITPLSPSANGYLPSGLLGDEENSPFIDPRPNHGFSGPDNMAPLFGNLSALNTESQYADPNSPNSASSRPHSLMPSPRDSLNNITSYHNPNDLYADTDGRSIHSTQASLGAIDESVDAGSGTRKLSNLLNPLNPFTRREKTPALDGFPIGSLKPGQSQSFPRNFQSDAKPQDPIGTRARSGSQTTFGMLRKFGRNPSNQSEASDGNAPAGARNPPNRRNRYDPFRSDSDPLEPSTFLPSSSIGSPRAGSVSSRTDSARPSTDQNLMLWPSDNKPLSGQFHNRDWSAGSDPWASRSVSRQHSLHQHPSPSTSSLGPTQADFDGPNPTAHPEPIGTKPKSFAQRAKLNPNAPAFSFKSLNVFESKKAEKSEPSEKKKGKDKEKGKSGKDEKKEKDAEKDKDKDKDKDLPTPSLEDSPPSTRRSRDNRSINTEISQTESRPSLDRSTSGTPSDIGGAATTPSAQSGRETFIQKLTRKGSSSKFNIGWKDKSGLFGKKSAELDGGSPSIGAGSATVEESAEGSGDSILGRSVESVTSSPNVGLDAKSRKGWGMLSRKRKGEKAASEASEKASETGDDDDQKSVETKP